jgi:hypothetical protein
LVRHDEREWAWDGAGGAIAWPASLLRAEASVVRRPAWQARLASLADLAAGSPLPWPGAAAAAAAVAALVMLVPHPHPHPAPRDATLAPAAPLAAAPLLEVAPAAAPVRLTGAVAGNLFRSLRAAGASASVAADALAAVATRIDVGTIAPGDRFDIVTAQGRLLYVGLLHRGEPLGLMRWQLGGREQWLDAAGTGAPSDGFIVPVADARLSSGYGMRFHPILGFSRMHQGVDLAAPAGTPIVAAAEGIVRFAGAHGGYGNFVQVQHNGGMGSGYGHMATIAVTPGQMVRQGDLLGTVGSTGLSTGPHCHFEIYRGGIAIDPTTANHAVEAQLAGDELRQFRLALARVTAVPFAG